VRVTPGHTLWVLPGTARFDCVEVLRRARSPIGESSYSLLSNNCEHFVLSIALLLGTTASAAEDFNGSTPMVCKPLRTHDCLPPEKICTPLKPEAGKDETMHVDVARMSVQTPFRNDTLPIASYEFNMESLVGHEPRGHLECKHSSYERETNHRDSGCEGAYVIFGQCALFGAKRPATARSN
jgi:Lecithin retinol acyltransferase